MGVHLLAEYVIDLMTAIVCGVSGCSALADEARDGNVDTAMSDTFSREKVSTHIFTLKTLATIVERLTNSDSPLAVNSALSYITIVMDVDMIVKNQETTSMF